MRYFSRNIAKRKRLFAVCNSRCGDESVYFESAGNTRNNYRSNLAQDVQPELKRGSIYVHVRFLKLLAIFFKQKSGNKLPMSLYSVVRKWIYGNL